MRKLENMKKTIAVLPGDGIGPEVINEALKVLKAIEQKSGHEFEIKKGLIGGAAIDQTGNPFPEETHRLCLEADAVLLGAVGDPKYDNDPHIKVRPEQGLLAMRQALGLYANIRPVQFYESLADASPLKKEVISGTDLVVVRELIGGIYFGKPRGRSESGDTAFDSCVYSKDEILRISKVAFEYARQRKRKVTLVDKANVLATSRLWREVVVEFAKGYPDIQLETLFVDNAAMKLIQNPSDFDVILTSNLFGDILSDEASVITGSLGLLPSASIGIHTSVFEPVHGSYPQAAGQNRANPFATILSMAMMLEMTFGLTHEAETVRTSIQELLISQKTTEDLPGKAYKTSEVGDFILDSLLVSS
jgi:3-isopropylmalate dehydrogenase